MRFLIFPTLTILAGGLLLAADSQSVTYIGGSVADLAPNTGATLNLTNPQALELQSPLHTVQVPYNQILKAELGAITVHTPEPEKLYKVWALPKRLMKSETQQMTVSYKNAGQDQTMTIELQKQAASTLLAQIERRSGKVAENNWWGDDYWKTTRNKDSWGGAGTIAQK